GEGTTGRYDKFPLHRFDKFDCETYVNTVIALSLTKTHEAFKQCLKKLRYKNGKISYFNRNHFTSIDWNNNNSQQHFLKDITFSLQEKNHHSVAKLAITKIEKGNWFARRDLSNIRLLNNNLDLAKRRLVELKKIGRSFQTERSILPFIPFTVLFNTKGK